jgi:hypothetical protein
MQEPIQGTVGKRVADHLYAHITALTSWPDALYRLIERAVSLARVVPGEHLCRQTTHLHRAAVLTRL